MALPRLKRRTIDHTLDKVKDIVEEIQDNADVNEEFLRKLTTTAGKILECSTMMNRNIVQMRASQQQMAEAQKELMDLTSKLHGAIMDSTITHNKEL